MYLLMLTLLSPISFAKEPLTSVHHIIKHTERKYKLPAGILSAIIKVESNGQVNAVNHDDGTQAQKSQGKKIKSYGLMQIQLATARHMKYKGTAEALRTAVVNVDIGARYLRYLLDGHGQDLALAITCYNSGEHSRGCLKKRYSPHVGKVLNAWKNQRK